MTDERDKQAVRQGEPLAPEVDLADGKTVPPEAGAPPGDDLATRTGATVTGKGEGEK